MVFVVEPGSCRVWKLPRKRKARVIGVIGIGSNSWCGVSRRVCLASHRLSFQVRGRMTSQACRCNHKELSSTTSRLVQDHLSNRVSSPFHQAFVVRLFKRPCSSSETILPTSQSPLQRISFRRESFLNDGVQALRGSSFAAAAAASRKIGSAVETSCRPSSSNFVSIRRTLVSRHTLCKTSQADISAIKRGFCRLESRGITNLVHYNMCIVNLEHKDYAAK